MKETNIVLPSLGESVSSGTISKWCKKEGDIVELDEKIAEVESDKVGIDINANVHGKITKILKNEGDDVEVGEIICVISSDVAQKSDTNIDDNEDKKDVNLSHLETVTNKKLSPSVIKMVTEHKINLEDVNGSGKNNRITKGDIINVINNMKLTDDVQTQQLKTSQLTSQMVSPLAAIKSGRMIERIRMTKLRRTIAQRLKNSQNNAAILSTFNEVDMFNITELRKKYREEFEKKHGIKLGFMSFFVKAAVAALQELPIINAQVDGSDILYHNYYDIGVAVSTNSGLVVPIIRNAEHLSFSEIEMEISQLGKKAKEGNLSINELSGGTFSITNGGVFGSLLSTPIINPPQSAIMGMHKIQDRPVVINSTIQIRPMMYIVLSYDHRIIDGKEAVTFLTKVKNYIESPERLLLSI
ncbi:dihydrolipoyllysine-residue succinyltransferase [Orientia chuto str. Dubai]|uniref:Dihydrolipoyllysine-residue succinyltransferase component of 2-oxoglutarate dehydrogenase complex n=1 Tax=Orientia chuto str. Dubai TaxID=1359168 RepID=A0A0F3MSD2_9RICK|nr:2-oxoglutarate dehydrogenase complex dihydrolipoyllysine-residue succinyltransferase [Candidatus Orientia mediorientalis]KJV57524.1 dihydrolipoyllysine-residue succinyltransferase [Orientia chuto str. Dubai]